MRILYFNPETDYALASGASFYTPPAVVARLKYENQLLPELYSRPGDVILTDHKAVRPCRCPVIGWEDLSNILTDELTFRPWGWNHALLRRILDAGVDPACVPSENDMDRLRELAHRRTTIALCKAWNSAVADDYHIHIPMELNSLEECMEFRHKNPGCWMKAPWSSSGRGVINTAADLEDRHIRPWCAGILRRQGSVMGETGVDRIADFASEWILNDGKATFLGISSFETSRRGKYLTNHHLSQSEMESNFKSLSKIDFPTLRSIQRKIIEAIFIGYSGPVGIDIIVCRDGSIRPFVEANLRITMGMIRLESARNLL